MTVHRAFSSDNIEGASPEILAAILAVADGPSQPYGDDDVTRSVTRSLGEVFERDVDVLLVSTGSAANSLALAALTPPWGSILCHADSHINNDEGGAPEFFTNGAKLVAVPGDDAKIDAAELRAFAGRRRGDIQAVQPSVVSLTQATETGSVYSLDELSELGSIAHEAGLSVHMDGARFANALVSLDASPADMTWRTGVDVLSFGATKNGTLTADAIVIFDTSRTDELRRRHKRGGQLMAKMRFQAAQVDAYLADDLWLRNARHANGMAARLAAGLAAVGGVTVLGAPEANIVFCVLPDALIAELLADGFQFYHGRWEAGVVRFVTSFATTAGDVDDLLAVAAGFRAAAVR